MASGNKTIAKNTVFLYIRTFITMIISLYTSRVILQVLGINDFGIYRKPPIKYPYKKESL